MEQEFKTLSKLQIGEFFESSNLPRFRTDQVIAWVYGKGISSYGEMSNLPKTMREQLAVALPLYAPHVVSRLISSDGSRKYLVEFHDGSRVETVGIPSADGRLTVCLSSQSGCAIGCVFCATGKSGLVRSLYPGEIVDQLHVVQNDFGMRVTNVVVMGQGEPFANYDNVIEALRFINEPKLLGIGARHITVSTCGILKGIERFASEPEQFTLAISLHSTIQSVRDSIMPSLSSQRLDSLRTALSHYSQSTGRRFTFEYALMKYLNDSPQDLRALIQYCRGLLCHVNLIPLNPVEDSIAQPVPLKVLQQWESSLTDNGIAVSIRDSRGKDIMAACGQLSSSYRQIAQTR